MFDTINVFVTVVSDGESVKLIKSLTKTVIQLGEKIMSNMDDVNAAVAAVQADVAAERVEVLGRIDELGTQVTDLQAQVAALQASNPQVDFDAVIAAIGTIGDSVKLIYVAPETPVGPTP